MISDPKLPHVRYLKGAGTILWGYDAYKNEMGAVSIKALRLEGKDFSADLKMENERGSIVLSRGKVVDTITFGETGLKINGKDVTAGDADAKQILMHAHKIAQLPLEKAMQHDGYSVGEAISAAGDARGKLSNALRKFEPQAAQRHYLAPLKSRPDTPLPDMALPHPTVAKIKDGGSFLPKV